MRSPPSRRLAVKGRAPKTGYSREQFGDGWASVDGCDTRDRILARDLRAKRFRSATRPLRRGERPARRSVHRRRTIDYVRGGASEVDIDHVVALGDAWQKGAQRWPHGERVAFANDPLNLLAVDASANRQKGDGDAATWLPPNKRFRCAYVARQVAVKLKYALSVTAAERDAMRRVLGRCPPHARDLREALLEPVVGVRLVVERLDLDVAGRAVQRRSPRCSVLLVSRRTTVDAARGAARCLELAQEAPADAEAAGRSARPTCA